MPLNTKLGVVYGTGTGDYKFALFVCGFVLIILSGFYLVSRIQKHKTEEHISDKARLKNQLIESNNGSGEPEKNKRISNSKLKKSSGKMNYLKKGLRKKAKSVFPL